MVGGGAPSSSLGESRGWDLSWAVGGGSLTFAGLWGIPSLSTPPLPSQDRLCTKSWALQGLSRVGHGG